MYHGLLQLAIQSMSLQLKAIYPVPFIHIQGLYNPQPIFHAVSFFYQSH